MSDQEDQDLPTIEQVSGLIDDLTGGLSLKDYMDILRGDVEAPAAKEDQDRLARIAVALSKVQQAARDNEVDVLNREHHASWDDIEWLHAKACRLTQENARLRVALFEQSRENDLTRADLAQENARLKAEAKIDEETIAELENSVDVSTGR